MKRFRMFLVASLVTVAFGLMAGCGSDDPAPTPTGTVVKGPVSGAKVFDSTGKEIGTTDANGKFPLSGPGPYTTSGGTYIDLATKAVMPAPVMKAPAGATNITALTTLVANDTTGTLKANIEKLGIKYDAALNEVTSTDKNAILLNELAGSIINSGLSSNAAVISALNTQLATVSSTTSTSQISSLVTTALSNAATTDPTITTTVSVVEAQIGATQTAVEALQPGPLPVPTGSTGTTPTL